jgi:hypothetical protein
LRKRNATLVKPRLVWSEMGMGLRRRR